MIVVNGFLDYSDEWTKPDIYMFTGNTTIKKNGALVMGRGAALAVRDLFPNVDKRINIKTHVSFLELHEGKLLGYFRVKENYRDNADLNIIEESVNTLSQLATLQFKWKFHLNYPGIGAGHLYESDVLPIVEKLPDNVILYR